MNRDDTLRLRFNEGAIIIHYDLHLLSFVREWSMINGYANHYAALDIMLDFKKDENNQYIKRQDNRTASFLHEILQNVYLINLSSHGIYIKNPELVCTLNICHDLKEDIKGQTEFSLVADINKKWGRFKDNPLNDFDKQWEFMCRLSDGIRVISKKSTTKQGQLIVYYKTEEEYYEAAFNHEEASLAKLADILQNKSTENGVKCKQEILDKVLFYERVVEPLIDRAKEKFPHHAEAYDALRDEIRIINKIHKLDTNEIPDEIYADLKRPSPFRKLPPGIRPAQVALERQIRNPTKEILNYKEVFEEDARRVKMGALILQ